MYTWYHDVRVSTWRASCAYSTRGMQGCIHTLTHAAYSAILPSTKDTQTHTPLSTLSHLLRMVSWKDGCSYGCIYPAMMQYACTPSHTGYTGGSNSIHTLLRMQCIYRYTEYKKGNRVYIYMYAHTRALFFSSQVGIYTPYSGTQVLESTQMEEYTYPGIRRIQGIHSCIYSTTHTLLHILTYTHSTTHIPRYQGIQRDTQYPVPRY